MINRLILALLLALGVSCVKACDIDSITIMSIVPDEKFVNSPTRKNFITNWLNARQKGLTKICAKTHISDMMDMFKSLEIIDTLAYEADHSVSKMEIEYNFKYGVPIVSWRTEDKCAIVAQIMLFRGEDIETIWVENLASVVIGRLRCKISPELKACLDKLLAY